MSSAIHSATTAPSRPLDRPLAVQDRDQRDELVVMELILNLDIGGAQEAVRTLVQYMASDRCTPLVCTFQDGPMRKEIEQLGIPVEILPPRKHSIVAFPLFALDMVRIWRALAALVRKYDVDVIQTTILASLDYLVLVLLYTTPVRAVYWTFQSYNFEIDDLHLGRHRWLFGPKKVVHRLLYRWSARLVSGYIAVSEQVAQALVDVIGPIEHKIEVIPNGVDVERYGNRRDAPGRSVRAELGLDSHSRLIAMVGTLKEVKGHRYMIEAMTVLASRYPDLHLLLVGDGALCAKLEAQVADAKLGEQVHFLGSRDDVAEILANSDLFVLPSLWEGLSLALLEAMATGLPIVASQVSGTVQAIESGQHGLLIPPGDTQAIIDGVSQVLSDPVQAQAMGAAAKERVIAEFSARRQADLHLNLFYRTLASKRATRRS